MSSATIAPIKFLCRCASLSAAALLLWLGACASVGPNIAPMTPLKTPAEVTADVVAAPSAEKCRLWYQLLDEAIARNGTQDAGAARLPGFPQLRADRFAASFKSALASANIAQRMALLDYLQDLDSEARAIELGNMPASAQLHLGFKSPENIGPMLQTCAAELTRNDFSAANSAASLSALQQQLAVPDQYATWKRALGLYALTSIPFLHGVEAWQRETAQRFADSARTEAVNALRYLPATTTEAAPDLLSRFAASPRDDLGIPQLSAEDWKALLAHYAPVFEVETQGTDQRNSDRIGALRFGSEGMIAVDIDKPVAYQRIAFTRYKEQTLTQLVYGIWFPKRPAAHSFDMLAGQLDGVMIRITLDKSGAPLLADSIHACGCYHLFFPGPRLSPRPAPQDNMEWAFSPARLPVLAAGQRLQVRLAASSHYLVDLRAVDGSPRANDLRYGFRDDNELRALPQANGGSRSAFDSEGIIPGSERGERFLFWPMGVASPGAMRQWGRHATAFVGRRHFDDADLIEQRFNMNADIKPE